MTDINSAELIKHASNSFLALKISYINAVSVIAAGAMSMKSLPVWGWISASGAISHASLGFGGSVSRRT